MKKSKRCVPVFLFLLLIVLLPTTALATDDSRSYTFELTAEGGDTVQVFPGDIVTVTLTLCRTDSDERSLMYAMQDEIQYDGAFFELVEGSELIASGVESRDIALRDGFRKFYMNFLSLTGGEEWDSRVTVGSFQLRVIGESGVSVITNENCLVTVEDGSDTFLVETEDLTVAVSTDCTVRFEPNGGTAVESQVVRYGEMVTKPNDPQREGYTFGGWFGDMDLRNAWSFEEDTVKGNMTLYAKWVSAAVSPTPEGTATGDPEDGLGVAELLLVITGTALLLALAAAFAGVPVRFDTGGGTAVKAMLARRGGKVRKPQDPQKADAVFDGWFRDRARTIPWDFDRDRARSKTTLHAKWRE